MTVVTSSPSPGGRAASSAADLVLHRSSIVPITIEQYQQMIEQGIVAEDSTVELLRGMLVRKDRSVLGEDPMGHSPLHAAVVALISKLIRKIEGANHLRI